MLRVARVAKRAHSDNCCALEQVLLWGTSDVEICSSAGKRAQCCMWSSWEGGAHRADEDHSDVSTR